MGHPLTERLRGARRVEWFALAALIALLALLLLNQRPPAPSQKTELEQRLEGLLSRINGVGEVSVMVNADGNGAITGVAVVAPELSDMGAYLSIQNALSTLLNVDHEAISIIGGDFY